MKNSKIKYILLTLVLILAGSLFLFSNPEPAKTGYEHNVYQWLWSENIGFISLNNVNCLEGEGCKCWDGTDWVDCDDITTENYGLNIDYDPEVRSVSGLVWSDNTGWICFGESCSNFEWANAFEDMGYDRTLAGPWCSDPPAGDLNIQYEATGEDTRKVEQGWGRIVNLAIYGKAVFGEDNWGWVSLTSKNSFPGDGYRYWTHINLVTRTLGGWAWSGTSGDINEGRGGYGWIAFAYRPKTIKKGTISGKVTDAETGVPITGIKIYTDVYFHEAETGSGGEYTLEDVEYSTYTITAYDPNKKYNPDTKRITLDEPSYSPPVDFALYPTGIPEGDREISGYVCYDQDESGSCEDTEPRLSAATVWIPYAGWYALPPLYDDEYGDGGYRCTTARPGLDYQISASYVGDLPGEDPAEEFRLFNSISRTVPETGNVTDARIPLAKRPLGPGVTGPWIQTWWSDVHAEKTIDVSQAPLAHFAHATYLITATDKIQGFRSFFNWRKAYYEGLGFPTEDISIFNPIDIERLIATVPTDHRFSDASWTAGAFGDESGIWYFSDEADADTIALEIISGNFGKKAKTVIVDGDLVFSEDILYSSDTYSKEELPSVGFIVRGNVIVKPNVEHAVGAFYVDKDKDGHGPDDPTPAGIFTVESTGDKTTETQFVCEGLIVARKFDFQREISSATSEGKAWEPRTSEEKLMYDPGYPKGVEGSAPSELIWYDSRVVVNTPKGFEDFSKALPVWEER